MSLEIEVSVDAIKKGMDKAFADVVKTVSLQGFRKGKIPRSIFEKNFGTDMLVKDGVNDAVNESYIAAVTELDLHVVDYPKNINIGEYKENQTLIFSCDVDVKPEIQVSKYTGIKVQKEDASIDEALIENQLKQLQSSTSEYKEVADLSSAVVAKEDLLKINVEASIDGTAFDRWTKQNVGVCVGSSIFSADFDEHLENKKANELVSFSVEYKEAYHIKEVAGKLVQFNVTITDIKKKELPELTDELVAKSSEYKTIEEFKKNVRESLEKKRQNEVDEKLRSDLLTYLVENHEFDIPEGLINHEAGLDRRYYENTLKQSGATLGAYLEMIKQSEDEFMTQLKQTAVLRIKQDLILEGIQRQEKISVAEADIHAEVKRLRPEADTEEKINHELKGINLEGFKDMILRKKTFDFLIDHAKIN